MGLFTLGVFVPFVSQIPALVGICFGIVISIWKYVGALHDPPGAQWTRPLTLDTRLDHFDLTVYLMTSESEIRTWMRAFLPSFPGCVIYRLSAWAFFGHKIRDPDGNRRILLQAYYHANYTQHIKNLEWSELILTMKFLHGRVLWKFWKWQFRKF